jgi:hypothetical protein
MAHAKLIFAFKGAICRQRVFQHSRIRELAKDSAIQRYSTAVRQQLRECTTILPVAVTIRYERHCLLSLDILNNKTRHLANRSTLSQHTHTVACVLIPEQDTIRRHDEAQVPSTPITHKRVSTLKSTHTHGAVSRYTQTDSIINKLVL